MRGPNHANSSGRPHLAGKTNTDPLKTIVKRFLGHADVPMEKLECGHVVYVRQDMIGVTTALRRRCRTCGDKLRQEADAT